MSARKRAKKMMRSGKGALLIQESVKEMLGIELERGRECGDCSACCVAPSINRLNKPAHTPCSRLVGGELSGGRCSRYRDRPNVCKGFQCGWLVGLGEEQDRPDKSGFIMNYTIPLPHRGAQPHIRFICLDPNVNSNETIPRAVAKRLKKMFKRFGVVFSLQLEEKGKLAAISEKESSADLMAHYKEREKM